MFLGCFHEDPPPRSCCRIPGCSREGFSLWCSWGGRQAGLHQRLGVGLCVGSATNSQEHSTSTRAQGKTRVREEFGVSPSVSLLFLSLCVRGFWAAAHSEVNLLTKSPTVNVPVLFAV